MCKCRVARDHDRIPLCSHHRCDILVDHRFLFCRLCTEPLPEEPEHLLPAPETVLLCEGQHCHVRVNSHLVEDSEETVGFRPGMVQAPVQGLPEISIHPLPEWHVHEPEEVNGATGSSIHLPERLPDIMHGQGEG